MAVKRSMFIVCVHQPQGYIYHVCVCVAGGMNTAGLGGIGGPYRLDIGQDVHQIPDWQKQAMHIPEEVRNTFL